jgi:predicted dehydrogenase
MKSKKIKLVCAGAGYFAQFHLEAWTRIPEIHFAALCEKDEAKGRAAQKKYKIPALYTDFEEMLDREKPDVVDIITPPATHLHLCRIAAERGVHIICQKPLAPTFAEAEEIVELTQAAGVRFMVHENWRFQPWYREIKRMLETGMIGDRLHYLSFRMRTGDGWPEDAYLNRQPYFRTMPQLLIFETGVHFIDTFRYLAGEIDQVYAQLRRLNPAIAGEDFGLVQFTFAGGALGLYDANRYNEPNAEDPRYTFGECLVEGNGGTIRLYMDGRLTLQRLGEPEKEHIYPHERRNFAGDCVYATQRHFVQAFLNDDLFETSGREYLKTLAVQEAAYRSAERGQPVEV